MPALDHINFGGSEAFGTYKVCALTKYLPSSAHLLCAWHGGRPFKWIVSLNPQKQKLPGEVLFTVFHFK